MPHSSILRQRNRFYDLSTPERKAAKEHPFLRDNEIGSDEIQAYGGRVRRGLFGVSPYLSKYPLVFYDGKVVPMVGPRMES